MPNNELDIHERRKVEALAKGLAAAEQIRRKSRYFEKRLKNCAHEPSEGFTPPIVQESKSAAGISTRLAKLISRAVMHFRAVTNLIIFTVVASTAFTHSVFGTEVNKEKLLAGISAYATGESHQSFEILVPLAEQGEPLAQTLVAKLYDQGKGVRQNCSEAFKWFTHAAEQGYVDAQFELGERLSRGICVTKDEASAIFWLERAARQNDVRAQNELGDIYFSHGDKSPDFPKAVHWYQSAAKLPDCDALYKLGVLYALGLGVQKDWLESYKWFGLSANLAADKEDKDKAFRARDKIRDALMPGQVAEAERRIEDWLAALLRPRD